MQNAAAGNYTDGAGQALVVPRSNDWSARGKQVKVTIQSSKCRISFCTQGDRPVTNWPLLVYLHDEARSAGRAPPAWRSRAAAALRPPAGRRTSRRPSAPKPMDLPWGSRRSRRASWRSDRRALQGRRPLRREARPLTGIGAGTKLLGAVCRDRVRKRFASIAPLRGPSGASGCGGRPRCSVTQTRAFMLGAVAASVAFPMLVWARRPPDARGDQVHAAGPRPRGRPRGGAAAAAPWSGRRTCSRTTRRICPPRPRRLPI